MKQASDIQLANGPLEFILARNEVPRQFWHTTQKNLSYRQFKNKKDTVTIAEQKAWVRSVLKDPRGQLLVLGGIDTDDGPMAAASYLVRELWVTGMSFGLIDAQNKVYFDTLPNVIVVHNVMHESPQTRIQTVRDLLLRFKNQTRILVVAGTKNPIDFATGRIRLRPTGYALLTDPKETDG